MSGTSTSQSSGAVNDGNESGYPVAEAVVPAGYETRK